MTSIIINIVLTIVTVTISVIFINKNKTYDTFNIVYRQEYKLYVILLKYSINFTIFFVYIVIATLLIDFNINNECCIMSLILNLVVKSVAFLLDLFFVYLFNN